MATLTLTYTIATAQQVTDIVDDFCVYHQYTGASGETKNQFVKRKVGEYVRQAVVETRTRRATDTAAADAADAAMANTVMT